MTACPVGHDSVATDYCDVCGRRMDAAGSQATAVQATAAYVTSSPATGQNAQLCPRCGAARSGRFCEGCGLDLDAPMPPAPPSRPPTPPTSTPTSTSLPSAVPAPPRMEPPDSAYRGIGGQPHPALAAWSVVATADRAYYDTVTASGGPEAVAVVFPPYCPERRFELTGREMRIGRRSASRGLSPEIDLTGPPMDPGISRLHAVLVANPDLGWSVIDPGSENGTVVNGHEIATGVPVPLQDGDRIHLGAWTLMTVTKNDGASS
jgi:pSer/pThr/pTyr-binding forkhead associated (FHA) protein